MTSEELRTRLAELESAAETAGAAVISAQTVHDSAIRHAILTGDHAAPEETATVLQTLARERGRLADMAETARALLAEAVRCEREAAQAVARREIDAELEKITATAAEIDSAFAGLVARILQLRAREADLRTKTREHFREVWGGSAFLPALRSLAGHLTTVANGLQPDAPSAVTAAAASGAHSIRNATNGL